MSSNPFKDASQKVRRSTQTNGLDVGRVTAIDPNNHLVAVKPMTDTGDERTSTSPTVASVTVDQRGDVALPQIGETVVIARFKNRRAVVLGAYYTRESQVPEYEPDERHIGADDGGGVFIHGPFGVVPKLTKDPTDAPDGAVWYRTDEDQYRGVEGGTTVVFATTEV